MEILKPDDIYAGPYSLYTRNDKMKTFCIMGNCDLSQRSYLGSAIKKAKRTHFATLKEAMKQLEMTMHHLTSKKAYVEDKKTLSKGAPKP